MSKENKQLENRKAFYDDFAIKFSETKLKEVIQKKREEAGFMNCAKRLSKQFPPLLKMTKKLMVYARSILGQTLWRLRQETTIPSV